MTLPKIIGIAGKAGSGKTTLAKLLHDKYNYLIGNFADPIKESLNAMMDWNMGFWENREWKEADLEWLGISPRRLAQTLGTEWGRSLTSDFWIKVHQNKWKNVLDPKYETPKLVIGDVRFLNEVEYVCRHGGSVFLIHSELDFGAPKMSHSSETQNFGNHFILYDIYNNDLNHPEKMLEQVEALYA